MEAQVSLTVAFRSSALLGLVSLIFLLTIRHRFSMGFRSGEFVDQSSTVTPWSLDQLLVPLSKVKVSFIVNSTTCTVHTYRELKLHYSLTPWCIQITLNTNSRMHKYTNKDM